MNEPCSEDSLRRLDVRGIGDWLLGALATYRGEAIEAIVPVGHGAGVAALADDSLAFTPLDYEQAIPPEVVETYRAGRDPFALTGSPSLPDGLNIGSQLFWLERLYPEAMRRAVLVPWAQYWAWFLSGRAVSEVTSLGCHSDLWAPAAGDFSPMARRFGWARRFAPLARAGDVAGMLRAELAQAMGLPETVRILTGLHDSNAALFAARGCDEMAEGKATLLSTGTWFVAMRAPVDHGSLEPLPEDRDCLINVHLDGRPVPSARFMGGREIELVVEADERRVEIAEDQPALLAAMPSLLNEKAMLLPTLVRGCGPFPSIDGGWNKQPGDWNTRRAAACLYAALLADASLDLIGASGALVIEGRFAQAEAFTRPLAALRPGSQIFTAGSETDVSYGALRLLDPSLRPAARLERVQPLEGEFGSYRAAWRSEIEQTMRAGGQEA